ncbi:DoxX family protein [Emticicia sp. 17c]|uniref:DoxX family protein n=1 Tax=Emticicia sp. 17c TaxID=3127704 RepID=UPI00301E3601
MSKLYRHYEKISLNEASFWNNILGFVVAGAAIAVFFEASHNSGCGDFPQHFQVVRSGVIIGAITGIVFNLLHGKIPNAYRVQPMLVFLLRMYLAWIIMSYGLVKVFASQFPTLMANMDARLIELSPMRVAWAFFGYSKAYQIYLGWGELIPAILLLFRRTTLIGSLLMVVVMLNVWLINIFFDVCVKLNSFIYLSVAVYILLQYSNRLWKFFFTNQVVQPAYYPNLADRKIFKRIGLAINILLVGYILYDPAMGLYEYVSEPEQSQPKDQIFGAWKVEKIEKFDTGNWVPVAKTDSADFNRCFFEGFTGVLQSTLKRQRFGYSVDSTQKEATLNFINQRNTRYEKQVWKYDKNKQNELTLQGRIGKDSLRMVCSLRHDKLLPQ